MAPGRPDPPRLLRCRAQPFWLADFTYASTCSGPRYTSFDTDAFARSIVGRWVSKSLRTDLAFDALEMGIFSRRQDDHSDLIHPFRPQRGAEVQGVVATPTYWTDFRSSSSASAGVFHFARSRVECENEGVEISAPVSRQVGGLWKVFATTVHWWFCCLRVAEDFAGRRSRGTVPVSMFNCACWAISYPDLRWE